MALMRHMGSPIVLSVGPDLRVLGFALAISVVLVHPGITLTRSRGLHYCRFQREGRIQSAERAVPTLGLCNLTNLLSA
jgi:hypothetical protein